MRVYTGGGVGPDDSEFYWRMNERGWDAEQERRQIEAGHNPDAVRRHLRAMRFGGLTTAEAYALFRDRDCGHRGAGHELWEAGDIPGDRWFRDAWRRSPAGGPIWIDLGAARAVQARRCVDAVKDHNARQERAYELWGHNGPHIIELDYRWIKRRVEDARDVNELRAVWPAELRSQAGAVTPVQPLPPIMKGDDQWHSQQYMASVAEL
jgi:hypothetical protein